MRAHKDEQTKPFRDGHGVPIVHGQFMALRARPGTPHPKDPTTGCGEILEHRGYREIKDTGQPYVDWYGDALHIEVYCPEHGFVTTVDTDFKGAILAERKLTKEQKGGDGW